MAPTRTWKHAIQETVQANRYVPIPPEVRAAVEVDHELDGPSVFWNYDSNANYVVLSKRSLREPGYVDVGRYKVYGEDDPDTQVRIRPPDRIDEVVRSNFTEGSRVMYLAYEEMIEGDNATVYLLSAGQLLELLPDGTDIRTAADGGTDLRETVLQTPGFMPSPR